MRDIEKNIEFFSDERYRDLEYGTIYYVPGVLSQEQKDLVRSRAEDRTANQSIGKQLGDLPDCVSGCRESALCAPYGRDAI